MKNAPRIEIRGKNIHHPYGNLQVRAVGSEHIGKEGIYFLHRN